MLAFSFLYLFRHLSQHSNIKWNLNYWGIYTVVIFYFFSFDRKFADHRRSLKVKTKHRPSSNPIRQLLARQDIRSELWATNRNLTLVLTKHDQQEYKRYSTSVGGISTSWAGEISSLSEKWTNDGPAVYVTEVAKQHGARHSRGLKFFLLDDNNWSRIFQERHSLPRLTLLRQLYISFLIGVIVWIYLVLLLGQIQSFWEV